MKKILSVYILLTLILAIPLSSDAEVVFYDTDNVGTPVAMWDVNGNKVWEAEYLPFGELYRETTAKQKNKKRFIGKEKDEETGLTYFGARYMQDNGRFISPDPVRPVDAFSSTLNTKMLSEPQRLNRYVYGLNNPYRYIDPDGEFAFLAAALAGAAIAYFSAPDIANAPESSATPTFASHGERNIALGAAGGLGVKAVSSAVGVYKLASQSADYDSGPVSTLYHGGKLERGGKPSFSTTPNKEHAAVYAQERGGKVHEYTIHTRRLYKLQSEGRVTEITDTHHVTGSVGKEFKFNKNAVKHLKKR